MPLVDPPGHPLGYKFRFGRFAIGDHGMALIARAMGTPRATLGWPDAAHAVDPQQLAA